MKRAPPAPAAKPLSRSQLREIFAKHDVGINPEAALQAAASMVKQRPGRRRKAPVLQLVPPVKDADTIAELHRLLVDAYAGKIHGLAYVALMPGPARSFVANTVGACYWQPLYTLACIRMLEETIVEGKRHG